MVDVLVLIVLGLTFISGLSFGVRRELWSLLVLAASTFIAGNLYLSVANLTGRVIEDVNASRLVAFAIVSAIVSAVLAGPVLAVSRAMRGQPRSKPWLTDRLAAGVLGVIGGIGSFEVGSALLLAFPVLGLDGWVRSSSLIRLFLEQIPFMMPLLPPELRITTGMFV